MRPDEIVIPPPGLDGEAGIVEALVPELPVEALDERVFDRLAGTNET